MKSLVIIPSRLNSTRLPEKPLILIKGKSLVNRVYHQVKKCKNKSDILIATDNEKIERLIEQLRFLSKYDFTFEFAESYLRGLMPEQWHYKDRYLE